MHRTLEPGRLHAGGNSAGRGLAGRELPNHERVVRQPFHRGEILVQTVMFPRGSNDCRLRDRE